jgi:Ca2+/Na+ antiporter
VIGFIRLMIFAFVALSVVYVVVSIYSRSVRREKLEKRWDADPPEGQGDTERRAFIEAGMRDYEQGLRKKLIWLVYIVPMVVFAAIVYIVSWQ